MLPKFSGRYKCEVRIDEPEFKMKAVSRHIIVGKLKGSFVFNYISLFDFDILNV